MPAYVLMKAFENAPARYDGAMDLLTLGCIRRLKRQIAADASRGGGRVLELGCGTGSLAVMMAERGAKVLAIDSSSAMLDTARQSVDAAGVAERIELRQLSVMEIDSLPSGSFDAVVATLVLSELSDAEIEFVLGESRRLLAPAGQLLIGDETAPAGRLRRLLYWLARLPLQLVTYLITQAQALPAGGWARTTLYFLMELPLMLLVFFFVPPTSRQLEEMEAVIHRSGFSPGAVTEYLGGSLKLFSARVG